MQSLRYLSLQSKRTQLQIKVKLCYTYQNSKTTKQAILIQDRIQLYFDSTYFCQYKKGDLTNDA
jgi:hypothetical protein